MSFKTIMFFFLVSISNFQLVVVLFPNYHDQVAMKTNPRTNAFTHRNIYNQTGITVYKVVSKLKKCQPSVLPSALTAQTGKVPSGQVKQCFTSRSQATKKLTNTLCTWATLESITSIYLSFRI